MKNVDLKTKLLLCIFGMTLATSSSAGSPANYCNNTAGYFSEFYAGLHKMNSHGFENFKPNSADQQAYFIQVQKNGEKLEANVIKSINNDIDLITQDKSVFIQLTHSLAEKLRQLAASDAVNNIFKEKEAVKTELLSVCP